MPPFWTLPPSPWLARPPCCSGRQHSFLGLYRILKWPIFSGFPVTSRISVLAEYRYPLFIFYILGNLEFYASLYCNFAHLYWEDCVIFYIYLRIYMERSVLKGSFICFVLVLFVFCFFSNRISGKRNRISGRIPDLKRPDIRRNHTLF